jgi:hypothetical protein
MIEYDCDNAQIGVTKTQNINNIVKGEIGNTFKEML